MKRPLPLKFFLVTIITPFFLFPTTGSADCKVDQATISLTMINKPLREILKDIEKQTKYTIKIDDPKALDDKKSIILNQSPLNEALRRLLKDINYSTICNDEQKNLTLVLLDKKSISSDAVPKNIGKEPQIFDIDKIDAAFEDYKNKGGHAKTDQQSVTSSMDGVTAAFEDYHSKDRIITPEPRREVTSMDGADDAFEDYKTRDQQTFPVPERQVTSMDGADNAFEDYKTRDRRTFPEPQKQVSSMDGADAAFEDYQRLQNTK